MAHLAVGLDAIVYSYFFDSVASAALPGPEDATESNFPEMLEKVCTVHFLPVARLSTAFFKNCF